MAGNLRFKNIIFKLIILDKQAKKAKDEGNWKEYYADSAPQIHVFQI